MIWIPFDNFQYFPNLQFICEFMMLIAISTAITEWGNFAGVLK